MANEIDLIIGDAAFKQISDLLLKLGEVDTKFGDIATKFSNLGKTSNPQSTAELAKLTAENEKLNKALIDLKASYTTIDTELDKVNKKIATSSKLITQETIDIRLKNKELTQEYTELSKVSDAYQKADAQYRQMTKSLKAMAFEGKEGTKDFIEKEKALTALGNRLKSVDAITGSHTRNVGNYASAWNGLGNSINQLTREAPAFANSLQTGFMALSNNIPILTDELGILINKNKQLQEQGKPTESILKTVAGAFFSWQTAISLGVTVLTVYGAKIWESLFGLSEAEKKQKEWSDAVNEANANITSQTTQLKSLISIVNDNTQSEKNRQLAYDEIKKTLPGLESATYAQAVATGELTNATDLYILSLIQKNVVEKEAKIIADQQSALNEETKKGLNERLDFVDKAFLFFGLTTRKEIEKTNAEIDKWQQGNIDKQAKALIKSTQDFLKTQKELAKFITEPKVVKPKVDKTEEKAEEERLKNKYARELSDLKRSKEIIEDKFNAEEEGTRMRISLSNELALSQIKIIEAQYKEEVRLAKKNTDLIKIADNNLATARENILKENGKRIIAEQERIHKKIGELADEEKYGVDTYFMPIEDVKSWVEEWNKTQKDKADKDKKNAADKKKIDEETANYLMSFGTEFASKAGFSETFNMLSGNIAGFGTNAKTTFVAVAESAQEMFNMIAESSQANFDQEYARLQSQKETSLKFAGDSTVAKERIEEQYEKKRKEIEIRQFKEKQKITLANIAIDTAQAIVSTWAQVPKYDFGISATALSIMIGAMGAVQAGMVLSQKPPAYAEGTDNHSGGLMLVNDGKGSNFQEKVILPSGKVIRPQGRNVLMDAPKGTKVLNHEQQLFEMLQSNNISMSSQQSSGMTSEEMDEILGKHFGNIKTQNTIFDKNGFQTYVRNGNSITRSNSNRSQAIGISV